MAHKSEHNHPLTVQTQQISRLTELPKPDRLQPEIWLVIPPFGRTIADSQLSTEWFKSLFDFGQLLHRDSVLCILTSSQDAAETWPHLSRVLKFQLWIAVKLSHPIVSTPHQLPERHAALLVLSKYRTSLRHTKTRIGYTFCPACDKTTKDYGGKKHTYNEYGTLMSDVWRDIAYTPGELSSEIVTRLRDLFGIAPYQNLNVVDARRLESIRPKAFESDTPNSNVPNSSELVSRLMNDDSLNVLRSLRPETVDFCFADPPYNLDKRYDAWDDAIDVTAYLKWCDDWLDELSRVLKPGCTCAVLNIPILAIRHFLHMKRSLNFQAWIAWESLSLPVRFIMPAHYSIVCFTKGKPRPLPGLVRIDMNHDEKSALKSLRENYCIRQSCLAARRHSLTPDREPLTDLWWDIHRLKHNSRRVNHPCQLPPALMRRLISLFTYEGEIVLDPFNGAGTTTLCSEQLRRRYIGIELSEEYHRLASARHELLQSGGDPFAKIKRVPKAKNNKVKRIGRIEYKVPKKVLQLEVRRIARLLGRLPTRDDVQEHARYPFQYYDEYFISWGEVCAAARHAGMSETRGHTENVSDEIEETLFDNLNETNL